MKDLRLFILCLLFITLFIQPISAHQPRIVYQQQTSQASPVIVKSPEISQAYYAELKGQPEYYKIISDREFRLYVQLLSPQIADARKDFSADVIKGAHVISILNGSVHKWTGFFEPFVGDSYWMGPTFSQKEPQGEYLVKVYNSDNRGKYILVVGKAEYFPLNEILRMFVALPQLKQYFGKSGFTAFFNLVGLFFLIQIIIISAVVYGIIWLAGKLKRSTGVRH